MRFKFKAIKQSGETYEGTREASDKFSLYQELKNENETVVYAEPASEKKTFKTIVKFFSSIGTVSAQDKISFSRNLGAMIQAGLSLPRALFVLERQTKNRQFKKIINGVSEEIKKGTALAEALKNYPKVFSPLFVAMVKAGEEGGTLASSLKLVSIQMNQTYILRKRVRGAMIYPAILVTLMITIAVLMLIFVIPSLTATFKDLNVPLPLSTKVIITVSDFFSAHTTLFFTGLILFLVGGWAAFRSQKGRQIFDTTSLHIPLIGRLVKETNSARTARTLSSLLTSGVSAILAFEITGEVVQNHHYQKVLKMAGESIQKGNPLYQIFADAEKLYPAFLAEMVGIGEETGKLAEMLMEVAGFYEEEVERQTKDMSTVIEPFLMILVGLAVGFFAVSMISPIYSLSNAI
ncbi:MAG: Type IV pilin [Parcubacteria group bacterium GW2011_GWB1_44_7]|uniref:Type IV pilin n=1 Tax=Candidatus Giovannonibacteria bacterium GW2011_GWA2_45_21 TaxID=1618649 RepID=A0A0G1M867_9BACT|nr:MAG: Type IV pilin [Parcubacteria group bacterium GW2011_GWB1_44_7]KKU04292.1 MAG: Type IV pilin [Candidatus Giovannonibacteria bacterium GW2011_GWA2_45_21]